jgi:GNAT superfamily N-acetyltransferase
MEPTTAIRGDYSITTDQRLFDFSRIHAFLATESYWAKNIPLELVRKSAANSLSFGVFFQQQQVGFARVITDYATTAYLADVYIEEGYRGHGLAKWLMEQITGHPELQGLRRWVLLTADAHGLYAQYGWKPIAKPEMWMEHHTPNAYAGKS